MIRAHRKAVEALAADDVTLYVSKVPEGAQLPYAVLHFTPGDALPTAYDAAASDWRAWPFVSHAYGSDAEQCQWVQERLERAWLDKRPTVAGRSCRPIRRLAGVPPEPDTDEIPPIVLARDSWVFDSIPA